MVVYTFQDEDGRPHGWYRTWDIDDAVGYARTFRLRVVEQEYAPVRARVVADFTADDGGEG